MTNEADTIATSIPESRPLREGRSGPMRWFMVGISVWYIVVAIAGFTPSYLAAQAGEFSMQSFTCTASSWRHGLGCCSSRRPSRPTRDCPSTER